MEAPVKSTTSSYLKNFGRAVSSSTRSRHRSDQQPPLPLQPPSHMCLSSSALLATLAIMVLLTPARARVSDA